MTVDKLRLNRRQFGACAGGLLASFGFGGGCRVESESSQGNDGRFSARPRPGVRTTAGAERLGLGSGRDAILHLPPNVTAAPLPLLLLLHGAGGSGEGVLRRLGAAADEAGVAVLAPDSRGATWDAIRDEFGPDVAFVDRALARVFETVAVDPARLAVGGFSDGASYALSLGLINADLFGRVVAFSPGFEITGTAHGRARFFISHGKADTVLPIDLCSRMIVPRLRTRGYDVGFHEFDGGHEIPPDIAREGMRWVVAQAP